MVAGTREFCITIHANLGGLGTWCSAGAELRNVRAGMGNFSV